MRELELIEIRRTISELNAKFDELSRLMGTIPQKNKTGNEKRSCCSAAHLFYSFSTSQNLEIKSAVKMEDYKPRNWLDR